MVVVGEGGSSGTELDPAASDLAEEEADDNGCSVVTASPLDRSSIACEFPMQHKTSTTGCDRAKQVAASHCS